MLFSVPILMGLLFYVGISMTGKGMTAFSLSAIHLMYDTPLLEAGFVLSAYLFSSPVRVLTGGWIADRIKHHARFAAGCFLVMGAMLFLVGTLDLPIPAMAALFAVCGFSMGLVAPSRDMLIRSLTPPRPDGKGVRFRLGGLQYGGTIAPPLYGLLLDLGEPRGVFWMAGLIGIATLVTVLGTGRQAQREMGRGR